ncbi:coil containing protein [Vibrio phage 1.031.O._10N.261.46.F8]|nr:coil containing protein [Vibrio phage 1.031.O._10N.261.46.F8]
MKKSVLGSLLVAAATEYANNLKQDVKDAGKSLLDELQDSVKRDRKYESLLEELDQLEDTRKRWISNGMSLTSNTIKLVDQAITDLRKAIQDYLDDANRETLRESMRDSMRNANESTKSTPKSPNMSKEDYDEQQELKSRVDFDSSANFEPTTYTAEDIDYTVPLETHGALTLIREELLVALGGGTGPIVRRRGNELLTDLAPLIACMCTADCQMLDETLKLRASSFTPIVPNDALKFINNLLSRVTIQDKATELDQQDGVKVLDPRLGALLALIQYHKSSGRGQNVVPMNSNHMKSNLERVIAITREEDDCRLLESAYLNANRGVSNVEYVTTLEEIYMITKLILSGDASIHGTVGNDSEGTKIATIDSITVSQLINHLDTEGNDMLVRHIMRAVARM